MALASPSLSEGQPLNRIKSTIFRNLHCRTSCRCAVGTLQSVCFGAMLVLPGAVLGPGAIGCGVPPVLFRGGAKLRSLKFGFAHLHWFFVGFFPGRLQFRFEVQEKLLCVCVPCSQGANGCAVMLQNLNFAVLVSAPLLPSVCMVRWVRFCFNLGASAGGSVPPFQLPNLFVAKFWRTRRWERPINSLWMPKTKRSSALEQRSTCQVLDVECVLRC